MTESLPIMNISIVDRYIVSIAVVDRNHSSLIINPLQSMNLKPLISSDADHIIQPDNSHMTKEAIFSKLRIVDSLFNADIGNTSRNPYLLTHCCDRSEYMCLIIIVADKGRIKCWEFHINGDNLRLMYYNEVVVQVIQAIAISGASRHVDTMMNQSWNIACIEDMMVNIYGPGLTMIQSIEISTPVSTMCFASDTILVMASSNNIVVYNIISGDKMIYQTLNIGSSSEILHLVSLHHDDTSSYRVAASTSIGKLFVYDVRYDHIWMIHEIGMINIAPITRFSSSLSEDGDSIKMYLKEEMNAYPITLYHLSSTNHHNPNILSLTTLSHIIFINAKTLKLIKSIELKVAGVSSISKAAISYAVDNQDDIMVGLITSFEKICMTGILNVHDMISDDNLTHDNIIPDDHKPSVLTSLSLFMSSSAYDDEDDDNKKIVSNLLNMTISPKIVLQPTPSSSSTSSWEAPKIDKKGKIISQPVTFHTRIRSSGYGQVSHDSYDRMMMKKRDVARRKQAHHRREQHVAGKNMSVNAVNKIIQEKGPIVGERTIPYDITCDYPTIRQDHLSYPQPRLSSSSSSSPLSSAVSNTMVSPILRIVFKGSGSRIAMMTTENTINTFHLQPSRRKDEDRCYMGHDGRVTDINFSLADDMLLTSSADGTAKIWKGSKVDTPALIFSHTLHQPSSSMLWTTPTSTSSRGSNSSSIARNKPFASEIIASRFYYMDKFILLASKSKVHMYSYDFEYVDKVDDLHRLDPRGRYEAIHHWNLPSQTITSISCLNTIHSPLIFAATSDKKLYILDAITGEIAQTIESGHDRSIHHIALPQPSIHVSLPTSNAAYNIYATAAIDNMISLWDIRTQHCIMRYTGHINRREAIGCSISPCLRYLATGSEDKTCRIVDLRYHANMKELYQLKGHRDVVMDVQWHPIRSQLASASLDGAVHFYHADRGILKH